MTEQVTQQIFDRHVATVPHTVTEQRATEYWYDSYIAVDDERGIGFISYHSANPTTYHIT